jgi:hypothetical protein
MSKVKEWRQKWNRFLLSVISSTEEEEKEKHGDKALLR